MMPEIDQQLWLCGKKKENKTYCVVVLAMVKIVDSELFVSGDAC